MDYTSRQLRAIVLVAHHRSFSRAAEVLCISPSGLSVLIREFESQLGFRLFDRTTRYVALTPYGTELLQTVRTSVDNLDAAVSRLARSANQASLSLSVGAPLVAAANILPAAIKEFRAFQPQLKVQVFDLYGDAIAQMVAAGKLDMGLGAFFRPTPGIRSIPLFRFSLVLIRPANTPPQATVTWSALRGKTLISLAPSNSVQQFIDQHLAKLGLERQVSAALNYLDTQIAMVEAGEGIAIVPSFILGAWRHRRVAVSKLINPVVNVEFRQIRNRGKKLPPGADEFTSFFKGYIARWAAESGLL
jgi:DNA-binding transcriptional LysR family regulator